MWPLVWTWLRNHPWRSSFAAIVIAVAANFIAEPLKLWWHQPSISVRGAVPIDIHWEEPWDGIKFHNHALGLIVALDNHSPTPAKVTGASVKGCIHGPMEGGDRLVDNTPIEIDRVIGLRDLAIQRILVVGQLRSNSADTVPAYGSEYIGILFPLSGGRSGAKVYKDDATSKDSISYDGNCAALKTANPEPSIFELFDIRTIEETPKGLAPDFAHGDVTFSVSVGSHEIPIRPSDVQPLKVVELRTWQKLLLAPMYNNPDAVFPPTEDGLP